MNHHRLSTLFSIALLLLVLGVARAQNRALLFVQSPSESLQRVVGLFRDPAIPPLSASELTWRTPYFVRIAPRQAILTTKNQLTQSAIPGQYDAILGTRPFVFLTRPESLYGRSLLEMYQDIGYEAEDILRYQLNQDMVAIVFRYPDRITLLPDITDGNFPRDWSNHVYVPYWDNAFSLFHHLAQEATVEPGNIGQFAPYRLFFTSEEEKAFALKFSKRTNTRLKNLPYTTLKARGGRDWRYRQLLENKLSLFEHFRGIGRTQNEVSDPDGKADGLVEFVGPNCKLADLPEVAVIDLGHISINTTYSQTTVTIVP